MARILLDYAKNGILSDKIIEDAVKENEGDGFVSCNVLRYEHWWQYSMPLIDVANSNGTRRGWWQPDKRYSDIEWFM